MIQVGRSLCEEGLFVQDAVRANLLEVPRQCCQPGLRSPFPALSPRLIEANGRAPACGWRLRGGLQGRLLLAGVGYAHPEKRQRPAAVLSPEDRCGSLSTRSHRVAEIAAPWPSLTIAFLKLRFSE